MDFDLPETALAVRDGVAGVASKYDHAYFGGMAYFKEYPVERLLRDARIGKNIPVAEELILAHIGTQMLDLPRSY